MATTEGTAEMNSLVIEVSDALDTYGDSISIIHNTNAITTDDNGKPITSETTTEIGSGFAYNNKPYSINLQNSSAINDSDKNMIMKSNIELNKNDIILHFNQRYRILDLELYSGADVKIAYELILGRV